MLVIIPLCLAIASSSWAQDSSVEEYDVDSMFGEAYQTRISEIGRRTEENLNCFLQFDQLLAIDWTTQFNLEEDSDVGQTVVNRFKDDGEEERILPKARGLASDIENCMGNLTKKVKNPAIEKCIKDLVSIEIEKEDFIAAPELFDNSLSLPFLTFLDIQELVRLLFQNRSPNELSPEEAKLHQVAREYLSQESSERDKVFVLDQACEWKNLEALQKRANNLEDQMEEFTSQVIRSISLQIANAAFIAKDLKPGRWISVYRRWVPVRLKNLKQIKSIINTDLKTENFTAENLCKYATVLASFYAEEEIKIIVPERISTLSMTTKDIKAKISSKEERVCLNKRSPMCMRFREMKKSYDEDLRCVESFGQLLSNHFLNSIMEKYADPEDQITYPERVCKKTTSLDSLVVRYCRCVGSFCTSHDVGELKANGYKFNHATATVSRV